MVTRYFKQGEVKAPQTWRLAAWALEHGADEFSFDEMSMDGGATTVLDRARGDLAPFALGDKPRARMWATKKDDFVISRPVWRLSPQSLVVLQSYFWEGLFTYFAGETDVGWLEDPVLYRAGEVMVGIISHEHEGYIELADSELPDLETLGLRLHDRGEWI